MSTQLQVNGNGKDKEVEQEVQVVLMETLSITDIGRLQADAQLLGHVPEFDSMAVVSVITGLEERFGLTIEDDELSADIFESVATLTDFVVRKILP